VIRKTMDRKIKSANKKPGVSAKAAKRPTATRAEKTLAKPSVKKVSTGKTSAERPVWSVNVYDTHGKTHESVEFDAIFHESPVPGDVVYQAIRMYRAGQREGTASTKDRGHVRGGGKKPWKQKGTGQARHGSRRSPIWRGGGTTFGPMPRDYSYRVPAKMRKQAVVEVIKDKIQNGKIMILNRLDLKEAKTKQASLILEALKLQKPLFLLDKRDENARLAFRNIRTVAFKTAEEVNALDLASCKECVMTKEAYTGLVRRLKS
jgi:large subunit ribosomal protein L4